jgi:hypothetical protein
MPAEPTVHRAAADLPEGFTAQADPSAPEGNVLDALAELLLARARRTLAARSSRRADQQIAVCRSQP